MSGLVVSAKEEINSGAKIGKPPVVILGAGASKAAVPKDKNGKILPLMKDLIKVLGLNELLAEGKSSNFERFSQI